MSKYFAIAHTHHMQLTVMRKQYYENKSFTLSRISHWINNIIEKIMKILTPKPLTEPCLNLSAHTGLHTYPI